MKTGRYVFSLYGPTRSGKSRLIEEMVKRLAGKLGIIRSVTTRPKRGPEDKANYSRHLSDAEFDAWVADGRIVQWVTYGGCRYGTARKDLKAVLARRHGICAMTEDGMRNMAAAGYRIVPVRVIPLHAPDDLGLRENLSSRDADDRVRALQAFQPLIVVVNDFSPGKFETVASVLERDLLSFMNGRTNLR